MSFSEDTIRKTGHRTCLRDMTGLCYPTQASTSSFSRASFNGMFSVTGSKGFQSKNLKKNSLKGSLIYDLWKIK